ncbi:hypothetical protein G7Y89_g15588 [Cudoniella acicularis]|uniref:Thioesterase domain-containing protein n=1 Tax=Cudoniella acicularis TaxID=354080 RepID=A0A8H4QK23_9HELO|nr:hypothetical protein G7Y89_g15588 [Cudoniella acicularis]
MNTKHLPRRDPTPEIKAHFASLPWCVALFEDPTLLPYTNATFSSATGTFNSFIGKTLATNDTIIFSQPFLKPPKPESGQYPEVLACLSLGSGVNGHHDTCHGGFVSVLLDEACGNAVLWETPDDKATMTAYLRVDYKKPVRTPGKILCRASVERKEGKKVWVKGSLEDGTGTVYATAETLFIATEQIKPLERL